MHTFGETLKEHFDDGDGGGGDEETEKLMKDKFVKGFAKLADGFSRFLQVGWDVGWDCLSLGTISHCAQPGTLTHSENGWDKKGWDGVGWDGIVFSVSRNKILFMSRKPPTPSRLTNKHGIGSDGLISQGMGWFFCWTEIPY